MCVAMEHLHPAHSVAQPVALSHSAEAQVYSLFALAMALTVAGVWIGIWSAPVLLSSGAVFALVIVELGIIFTSRLWVEKYPLNYLLFGLFPAISGITVAPLLMAVLIGYANGGSILLNALLSTAFMAGAAAVFARTTSWNLGVMGRALFFALLGLIALALLQIFIPALRGTQMELIVSGGGIVVFGLFTAYDIQRVQHLARAGASPFLLALSLYLDIFNLFLYILRFMIALSGERR